jgi:DNA-3-methyladenine glycosylase
VAPALIGRTLYRITPEGLTAGRIVEVEAYCGSSDPGSHAFRGKTRRNAVMFGPPGHLYVYFTYGMHYCANIVTDSEGVAGAVLLRAVEPTEGLDLMALRRGFDQNIDSRNLARGPARLCQAFALDLNDNSADLTTGEIWVGRTRRLTSPIKTSPRIGLKPELDQPWRFYEPSPWASRR